MVELLIFACVPGVVLFVLEWILIRVTQGWLRLLRFLPLLTLLIPLALAAQEWQGGGWFWEIAALFYLVMAGLMLLGWSLAWIGAVGKHKDRE